MLYRKYYQKIVFFLDTSVHALICSGRAKAARSSTTAAAASVATVDDVGDFSLQKTISNIEQRLDSARLHDDADDDDNDDDVMPAVANEMGAGE